MVITKTIYIKLLDEGTDAWRPTLGEMIVENIFQVLPTNDYDPELEEWEFIPGTIVKCKLQKKTDRGKLEEVLVAVERLSNKI
jgi:hypothetical protein